MPLLLLNCQRTKYCYVEHTSVLHILWALFRHAEHSLLLSTLKFTEEWEGGGERMAGWGEGKAEVRRESSSCHRPWQFCSLLYICSSRPQDPLWATTQQNLHKWAVLYHYLFFVDGAKNKSMLMKEPCRCVPWSIQLSVSNKIIHYISF